MKMYIQKGVIALIASAIILGCMTVFWLSIVGMVAEW